ncbi:MAG: hypothetical protein K0U41_10060 [Gammaproteobacteria bacterium]|nr:hypothetical protein [Gammaproteobacteria bacterium]
MKQKKEQTSTLEHLKRVKELEEKIEEMLSDSRKMNNYIDTVESNVKHYQAKYEEAKKDNTFNLVLAVLVSAFSTMVLHEFLIYLG